MSQKWSLLLPWIFGLKKRQTSTITICKQSTATTFFLQNSHIFPFFWGGSVPNKCVESFQQCIPSNMVLSEKEEWVLIVLYASETWWWPCCLLAETIWTGDANSGPQLLADCLSGHLLPRASGTQPMWPMQRGPPPRCPPHTVTSWWSAGMDK